MDVKDNYHLIKVFPWIFIGGPDAVKSYVLYLLYYLPHHFAVTFNDNDQWNLWMTDDTREFLKDQLGLELGYASD